MALRCWVQEVRLRPVNGFKKLEGVSFASEVDQIFIVPVNSHIGKGSPRALDLLSSDVILGFELDLLLALDETTPSPLDLNCRYVIHREPMILEQAAS